MVGAILKATNSSLQKCMTFCRTIYVKKVMKLLAFILEQTSYEVGFEILNKKYLKIVGQLQYSTSNVRRLYCAYYVIT